MSFNTVCMIWSGAVVFWALSPDDGTPAAYIHKAFCREVWRDSGFAMRLKLCGAFLLRPFAVLGLAAYFTALNGRAVKQRSGKGFARQIWEELSLSMRSPMLPPWYYIFELYEPANRKNLRQYLNRFETKCFVYKCLREYDGARLRNMAATTEAISNKALFATRCREKGLPAVPALMVVKKGEIAATGSGVSGLPEMDLFFKPLRGAGGRGAERWDYVGADGYKGSSGVVLTEAELLGHLKDLSLQENYVVRPTVTNHRGIADLSNGALSTARIVTCRNERGAFEVTNAVFRMACRANSVVDNFHAGGIVAKVDVATGVLGRAVEGGRWGTGTGWHDRHPVTEAQIAGRRLPCWDQALDLARRAHGTAFSDQAIIGWDVAILDDGPHLVEANKGPCVDLLQKPEGGPLGNARLGQLLAFNLKRALEIKYAGATSALGADGALLDVPPPKQPVGGMH
jgi:hypothetical protein